MSKINRFSLLIIDKIKLLRLINGKSAYQLSLELTKSRGYVTQIESASRPDHYNSADYPLIAEVLGHSLRDLLPPDHWEVSTSHEKVEKIVASLKDRDFAKMVLEGIQQSENSSVLKEENTLYRYLNIRDTEEKKVIGSVLKEIIAS